MYRHLTVSKLSLVCMFFFLSFSLVFSPFHTLAQSNLSLYDQLQSELNNLISENNLNINTSQSLEDLNLKNQASLKDSDIYFKILNTYSDKAQQEAFYGLSLATGFTEREISDMIEKGFLYPILTDNVNETNQRYQNISRLYEQEIDFFRNIADLKIDAIISEIFVDNNTTNSGFDLISDLNKIEQKLFFGTNASTIFNNPTQRNDIWKNFNASPSINSFNIFLSDFDLQSNPAQNPNQPNINPIDGSEQPILNLESNFQFPKLGFGLVCPTDPELYQEIQIYNTQNPSQVTNQNQQSNSTQSSSNQSNTSGLNNSGINQNQNPAQTSGFPTSFDNSFFESSSSCPEGQIFCLLQETKTNQISLKFPSSSTIGQDCITCVINRINQSLQQLLDNGVLPKKVTGNFAEPPICKEASFGKLGLNINFYSKPVRLPDPNSQPIQQTNLTNLERSQSLQNSLTTSPNFSLSQEFRPKANTDLLQQQNSLATINNFEDSLQQEFNQNAIIQRALQDQKVLFDTLDNQMSNLNLYFESFNQTLQSLESNFQVLANRPECSSL